MNCPEEVAQLSLGDSQSSHPDSWATLTGQAKPAAKDCDGRKLLGKRHSFDQDRNGSPYSMHHRNNHNNDTLITNSNSTTTATTIDTSSVPKSYGVKPSASYSMPINSPSQRPLSLPPPGLDDEERVKLMRDIMHAKEELLRFRNEMDGLAQQIDGMAIDLNDSKDRVLEIEDDLTSTQEVNVDLQVLLENAVKTQRESDGQTTHMIRNMHSNLANIVYENSQLQERLASLAMHQEKYQGNVVDVGERMREYAHMLEQAQGTIQYLQAPRHSRPIKTREDIMNALSIRDGLSSRRASDISSIYLTEDDEVSGIASRKQSETTTLTSPSISPDPSPLAAATAAATAAVTVGRQRPQSRSGSISPDIAELYRHRIIRKRPSLPSGMSPLFTHTCTSQQHQHQPQQELQKPKEKKAVDDAMGMGAASAGGGVGLGSLIGEGGGAPSNSPQQGLRLLLRNQGGHGLGLSSLADSKQQ